MSSDEQRRELMTESTACSHSLVNARQQTEGAGAREGTRAIVRVRFCVFNAVHHCREGVAKLDTSLSLCGSVCEMRQLSGSDGAWSLGVLPLSEGW